ncbi:hypothetical protein R1sor_013213 [Riccia sorocarpa]|uniref:Uncharacterized protein n=1 Tax=Riccia sorocarpa TaxID=122646 RepID=A0ABD3H9U1_9MARC
MPFARTMGNMVLLPNLHTLIFNGAQIARGMRFCRHPSTQSCRVQSRRGSKITIYQHNPATKCNIFDAFVLLRTMASKFVSGVDECYTIKATSSKLQHILALNYGIPRSAVWVKIA